MKKLILATALAAFVAASCTKTKTITLTTPPIHDTITTPPTHDTLALHLVGSWTNNVTTNRKPTFSLDTVTWSGELPSRYVASGDTIFYEYPNRTIYPEYIYRLNKTGDTLTLTEITPYTSSLTYWR